MSSKQIVEKYFQEADVRVNGDRPWDIRVHNPRFYSALLSGGSLAMGESYMQKWWDSECLDELICKLVAAGINKKITGLQRNILYIMQAGLTNLQKTKRAFQVGVKHYDIGNDLFSKMLDKRLSYTCAYWRNAKTLNEAQEAKLDLICKKLYLKPGMKLLDLGCGWGSFAKFAAEKYQVEVTGVTVSKEQVKLGNEMCKDLPVELKLMDYRDVAGQFDRVVTIGMLEHVGPKNYRQCMKIIRECLKPDGLFLLHTVGGIFDSIQDQWVHKYIFPNACAPSMKQIVKASEHVFVIEDWHNFGTDYDKTLMAWFQNFDAAWGELKQNYDETFYRMWKFYLLVFAGYFRARYLQLWQVVFSKNGLRGGYASLR